MGEGDGREDRPMDIIIESDVPHTERHNRWVGDIHRANHISAIFIGNELDAEVCDVEAGEFV